MGVEFEYGLFLVMQIRVGFFLYMELEIISLIKKEYV